MSRGKSCSYIVRLAPRCDRVAKDRAYSLSCSVRCLTQSLGFDTTQNTQSVQCADTLDRLWPKFGVNVLIENPARLVYRFPRERRLVLPFKPFFADLSKCGAQFSLFSLALLGRVLPDSDQLAKCVAVRARFGKRDLRIAAKT